MTLVPKSICCLVMALFAIPSAYACPDPSMETQTFLSALPQDAKTRDFVAKVKVISSDINETDYKRHSIVKIIEPVKNLKENQAITVLSDIHSCARDYTIIVNEDYYISGSITPEGYFTGSWEGLDSRIYWNKEH